MANFIKTATQIGSSDTSFEQSFANIAHSVAREKAPGLFDYEVGFQILDKNEDNDHAVGVFGFKVGSQWLYAPVFFLKGELKGHELLYVKNQDQFLPMKENWLNYLLNRKPQVLGDGISRNLAQIGHLPAHLYQLSRSPYKFASAVTKMSGWVQNVLPDIGYFATVDPRTDKKFEQLQDLPTFLKSAGPIIFSEFLKAIDEYPLIGQAVDKYHGLEKIAEIAKQLLEHRKEAASVLSSRQTKKTTKIKSILPMESTEVNNEIGDPIKAGTLKVAKVDGVNVTVTNKKTAPMSSGLHVLGLSESEAENLIRAQFVVTDKRDDKEVTIAYTMETSSTFQNPDDTGLYDVLVKPFGFKRCLILMGPADHKGKKQFCTVIAVDGRKKAWINTHPSNVWVANKIEGKGYDSWWNDQKDCDSIPKGGLHVVIGKNGEATLPFSVDHELANEGGIKSYDVWFRSYCQNSRPGYLPAVDHGEHYDDEYESVDPVITLTNKEGSKIRIQRGEIMIPTGCKLITLEPAQKDNEDDGGPMPSTSSSETFEQLRPGNLLDFQTYILNKTASLDVSSPKEAHYLINGKSFNFTDAVEHLVAFRGLREKQALSLLKNAKARPTNYRLEYGPFYKAAAPWDLRDQGPNATMPPSDYYGQDIMASGHPTQFPIDTMSRIPDMSSGNTDRTVYDPRYYDSKYPGSPDPETMNAAMQAAQTGQKELFDTSMISSLLKSTSDDNMVDKYLGDLFKGIDRLGRIMFHLYWHHQEMSDRYGDSELHELEDNLRSAFMTLGDVVLFLKQKSLNPDPEVMGTSVDLDSQD